MVQYLDVDHLARVDELGRDLEVVLARGGIAAGVVVHEDHGCGRIENGGFEHLAGMDDARGQAAHRYGHATDEAVARVEHQDHEDLLAQVPESRHEVARHVGARNEGLLFHVLRFEPAADFDGGGDLGGLDGSHARHLAQLGHLAGGEMAQSPELLQQVSGDVHDVLPPGTIPRAQQQGDQFCIGKGLDSILEQPFPGLLFFGPVPDRGHSLQIGHFVFPLSWAANH